MHYEILYSVTAVIFSLSMKRYALVVVLVVGSLGVCGTAIAASGPMADAGLDQTVTVETAVQLDGTGSAHPDGDIRGYEWAIEAPDGSVIAPDCPSCERTQFTPEQAGRYEVTVTVRDDAGDTDADTLFVYVEDAGPSVDLAGETVPDVGEPVEFTATAESLDAELEEVAWAVDDEIVIVQRMDGRSDESELSMAFAEAATHRAQVVVTDADGRTAYDQLYVQPQIRDAGGSSMPSIEETPEQPDRDPTIIPGEIPMTSIDIPREQLGDPESIIYQTDGFESIRNAGALARDSSYIGMTASSIGLDGGENAPWEQSIVDKAVYEPIDSISRFLFGQEQETVRCSWGDGVDDECSSRVMELEELGRTTNVHSPDESGAYSEYGLRGADRIEGDHPLEYDQEVEVTIVIQSEEEGLLTGTAQSAKDFRDSSSRGLREFVGRVTNRDSKNTRAEIGADAHQRTQQTPTSTNPTVEVSERAREYFRGLSDPDTDSARKPVQESDGNAVSDSSWSAYDNGNSHTGHTVDSEINRSDPNTGAVRGRII